MSKNSYVSAIQNDKDKSDYFLKYLNTKSEQQKYLEKILNKEKIPAAVIGDIACGAGTLTYHISKIYPDAEYSLIDLNPEVLNLANQVVSEISRKDIIQADIYQLDQFKEKFDLVFCWQTHSWLEEPEKALNQIINTCKKGGRIFISSLFNHDHDVDLYTDVYDLTRVSGSGGLSFQYNTYSAFTVNKWLKNKVHSFKFHQFSPEIDFDYNGRGIGGVAPVKPDHLAS